MDRAIAVEAMAAGDLILCRQFKASKAAPDVANGRVRPRPKWAAQWHGQTFKEGDLVMIEPIEGQGERDLQAIAEGPIMDPVRLYLPAGKLTQAEYQARLDLQFKEAGIEQ